MQMKRASEFMIPLQVYPHVPYWFTIRQTVAIMDKAESGSEGRGGLIGGRFVLVFNENYTLLGTVRRWDIFQGLQSNSIAGPDAKSLDDSSFEQTLTAARSPDSAIRELRNKAEHPISELMRPIESTVDHEDHLLQVMSRMVEQNASMLPVLRDNVVIGVVRSVEVFQEIASLIL